MIKFFNTFARAREHMAKRFRKDCCLFYGYQANIAMLLHDRGWIKDLDDCNAAAIDILELVFFDKRGARSKAELKNIVKLSKKTGMTKLSGSFNDRPELLITDPDKLFKIRERKIK